MLTTMIDPMCITIPSSTRVDRNPNPGSRSWRWLTDSPLRLLLAGGIVSLSLLALMAVLGGAFDSAWNGFNLLFGILPIFLFGGLLQAYPVWLKGTAVRYSRYGLLFFLLLGTQLTFLLSMLLSDGAGLIYLALLVGCWYLGISTLQQITLLALESRLARLRWIIPLLKTGIVCLLVAAGGLLSGWGVLADYAQLAGIVGYLIPVGLLSLRAHLSHLQRHAHIH